MHYFVMNFVCVCCDLYSFNLFRPNEMTAAESTRVYIYKFLFYYYYYYNYYYYYYYFYYYYYYYYLLIIIETIIIMH
jgi:hypothetical protein